MQTVYALIDAMAKQADGDIEKTLLLLREASENGDTLMDREIAVIAANSFSTYTGAGYNDIETILEAIRIRFRIE